LKTQSAVIWDSGDNKFSVTNVATVGNALVNALQRPAETENKYLYVASFTVSQNQILDALEKATKSKWKVSHTTWQEMVKEGEEKLKEGDYYGYFIPTTVSMIFREGLGANYDLYGTHNDLLNLPEEDLYESTARAVAEGPLDI
jgi:hypothetical protein